MKKEVLVLVGAGQIGLAIARRTGYNSAVLVADKNSENARSVAKILQNAGFDAKDAVCDLASRDSIQALLGEAASLGDITRVVNAAGVSPSQAGIETILRVDLYGTAVLLEEAGRVIAPRGSGVTISSQSGHRMEELGAEKNRLLATTPTEDLLKLDFLQPANIRDTLHAYQLAKRCNVKRVMYEAVRWGAKRARINSISPGIIVTPLAIDEFNGPRGDFYRNMFVKSPAGRPGTADEVANVAEFLLSERGAFITGSDILMDGGATASFFYGDIGAEPRTGK
jgi:NAD(P)-dependent dehydrogenase (short-subunit alcohol dehydrogenase family)